MQVLIIGIPKFPIPPEQFGGLVDGAIAWSEKHADSIEVFGGFPGGGGFGIVDVPDSETLNQIVMDMPFSWFSDVKVYPFVKGEASFRQLQETLAAMAISA